MTEIFDLVTIGAGSGGVRASRFSAQRGAKVAVIESTYLGGTCVNAGCIPKKMLSYAAHFAEDFHDAAGYGWRVGESHFSWPALIAAKDAEIKRLNDIYRNLLVDSGVSVYQGHARIADASTVTVGEQRLSAKHILVATGSRPTRPPIPGAELGITSDEAFHLATMPARVLIYGAGYIALEFASIFNGLGARTTVICRTDRVLRSFDHDISAHLEDAMKKRGVDIRMSTRIEALVRVEGGIEVTLDSGATITVDCVLFAIGRAPRSVDLGLEAIGVKLGANGGIAVDDNFRSSVDSIYAIGDVIDRIQLTPVALREGMTVADDMFGEKHYRTSYVNVPSAVFAHPNVASVGLSEHRAVASGHTVRIFRSVFSPLKHVLSKNRDKVLMKLVVDAVTDVVLGVHMVGPEAGEIIQGFALALNCGAKKADFDRTIGIHPTMAEEFVTMRVAE